MKQNKYITIVIALFAFTWSQAQETKIPFKSGVVKLCSSKNFTIKGYDGNEVIIKSMHSGSENYKFTRPNGKPVKGKSSGTVAYSYGYGNSSSSTPRVSTDSTYVLSFYPNSQNEERSDGLKKLGKKAAAEESGIYLDIEQKAGELIIKDNFDRSLIMVQNEAYEILIPNSVKFNWETSGCGKANNMYFFSSNISEIKDFKGEVEITTNLNHIKLTDVSGPVSINTIGGNVTIEFDKTTPSKLYSIYTNNGFIDVKMPSNVSIAVDAKADEIMSDLDFDIITETDANFGQHMNLKLGSGKVKMKLDAGYGNIYLRKR